MISFSFFFFLSESGKKCRINCKKNLFFQPNLERKETDVFNYLGISRHLAPLIASSILTLISRGSSGNENEGSLFVP